jgi:tetratricopeptide (TPR) repeat protein
MVAEYILWLRRQGRYREALALLEGCEAAGATGDRLSAALMFVVQMRHYLGDLSQTQVEMLNRAFLFAETDEQRSALLHELGRMLRAQGDLPGARATLERTLEINATVFGTEEHPSVATSLHELAGVLHAQGDLPGARATLERTLEIKARLYGSRDHYSTALSEMNLGFLLLEQGDPARAVALLRHAYQVFHSQLGPEHSYTQSLARWFADNISAIPDPVREATTQARTAAQRGDLAAAIEAQEQAVAHLRSTVADDRDTLVRLSMLLYNLAGYYSQAERWHDAVTALAEVVALDERTGHEDLASDRAALEQAQRMAAVTPEEHSRPEAAADALSHIQALADQARDAASAALRGEFDRYTLLAWLDEIAERAAADEIPLTHHGRSWQPTSRR